jgi:hypothetical protein
MSRLRFNKIVTPATPAANKGEVFYSSTLSPAAPAFIDEAGIVTRLGGGWSGGATGAVGGGFAADTYMTGTSVNVGTVGSWKAGMVYVATFDMVKTGAGIAIPVCIVRMGTLGTTGDAAILTFNIGAAQTGVIDTAVFTITVEFRSVGSGTSAVIAGVAELKHQLASTGFSTTGTAGYVAVPLASSGFNSTTSNIIGVSFNGGASFVGTNIMSSAELTS